MRASISCFLALLFSVSSYSQNFRLCLPTSHTGRISAWEISPNNKMLVTASFDNKAIVWDVKTGKKLVELIGHLDAVKSALFTLDNESIITSSNDKSIKIWNIKSGKVINTLIGHRGFIYFAKLSPDGTKILSVGGDSTAIVWEVKTGKIIFSFSSQDYILRNAFFSNDSKLILANYNNTQIKAWDIKSGKNIFTLFHEANSETTGFSKNGKYIITHTIEAGIIYIWDATTGERMSIINNMSPYVWYSAIDPTSKKIMTKSGDYKVRIFDISSGKLLHELIGPLSYGYEPKFNHDGSKIVFRNEQGLAIWNMKSEKLDTVFIEENDVSDVRYSPEGKFIYLEHGNGSLQLIKGDDWRPLVTLNNNHISSIDNVSFFPDDSEIFFTAGNSIGVVDLKELMYKKTNINNFNETIPWLQFLKEPQLDFKNKRAIRIAVNDIEVIDIVTGKIIKQFESPIKDEITQVASAEFNSTGEKIIVAYKLEKEIIVWDIKSGLISLRVRFENEIEKASFTPDNKNIIIISPWKTIQVINANTGTFVSKLIGHTDDIYEYDFNKDISLIGTASRDSTAAIWEIASGKKNVTLKGHLGFVDHVKFSPDNKTIITGSYDNTAKVWDANSGKLLFDLRGHTGLVNPVFSHSGKKILLSSADQSLSIWNASSGKKIFGLFFLDSINQMAILPDGYYKATVGAVRQLHYVTNDLAIISFDQLDIKYNRPDKVLEAIGSADTALISSYKRAYLKRIKKLGIDTTSFKEGFTIPEAEFKNRNAVEYEQKTKMLKLQITGNSTENLDRFNVWVNEVPLYGQKGINLRYKNKKNIDTTLSIILSEGDNSIETSIIDVNGIESYRQPLFVKYTPEKKQPSKTYFIGIGINRFADGMNNLSWSVKDIRDLAIKFASKNAVIDTLFDENVTTQKIIALKNKLLQTNEEDKVIISYSGHGLLSKEYDYFLSTYNTDFRKPEQNGLAYEELENLLDGIKARKKLLLIDACHSGEVDKEEMKNYEDSKDFRKKEGVKGLIITPKDSTKVGMRNSFEVMQELFVNVGRGTGATVISAASGTQFALERGDLKNGVFTYCLLEAMINNSTLKVSDLKKVVTEKVPQLTAGLQRPTFRSETQQFDWELW